MDSKNGSHRSDNTSKDIASALNLRAPGDASLQRQMFFVRPLSCKRIYSLLIVRSYLPPDHPPLNIFTQTSKGKQRGCTTRLLRSLLTCAQRALFFSFLTAVHIVRCTTPPRSQPTRALPQQKFRLPIDHHLDLSLNDGPHVRMLCSLLYLLRVKSLRLTLCVSTQ